MIYPALNISISRIDELRSQKEFVGEVVSKSQGLPIVACTYQKAGIISYYSGTFVPSLNLNGRRNQFSIWHSEDSLRLRKVAFINNYLKEGTNIQNRFYRDYKVSIIDSLPVMSDIIISGEPVKSNVGINEEFSIKVLLDAAKAYYNYKDAGGYNTRLYAELWSGDILLKEQVCLMPIDILLNTYNGVYIFRFVSPAERGTYNIKITLKTSLLGTWRTGKVIVLNVR
jgi:hypothetical protein